MPVQRTRRFSRRRTAARRGRSFPDCAAPRDISGNPAPAAWPCIRSCSIRRTRTGFTSPSRRPDAFRTDDGGQNLAADQSRAEVPIRTPRSGRGSRPLRSSHRPASVASGRAVHAEALGRDAHRQRRRVSGPKSAATCRPISAFRSMFTRTNRKPSTSCPSRAIPNIFRRTGSCACIAARRAATNGKPLTKGLPQKDCYVNVLRDAMAVDSLESCGVYFGTTGGQVYASADGGNSWNRHRPRPAGGVVGRSANTAVISEPKSNAPTDENCQWMQSGIPPDPLAPFIRWRTSRRRRRHWRGKSSA